MTEGNIGNEAGIATLITDDRGSSYETIQGNLGPSLQDPSGPAICWDSVSIWCIDLCHFWNRHSPLPSAFLGKLLLPSPSIQVIQVFLVFVSATLFMDECSAALIIGFKTGH